METARRTGKKCVVYDKTGEFTEYFYREERDYILNPLDARCAPWTVFADLKKDFDFASLSTFFVPENKKSADPVWDNAARILLEDIFRIVCTMPARKRNMQTVQEIITRTPLEELSRMLKDHDAVSAATINPKNERGSESIRLTLAASPTVKFFRYLPAPPPAPGAAQFSIRSWVANGDDSWLFLSSRADQHELLKPFISLWVELSLMAVMSQRPAHELKYLLFLDELASLQKMRGLEIALTEARKFGVATMVGLQDLSQLDAIYGDWSKTIAGNCQNKLILRAEDETLCRRYADLLGKQEIHESKEGVSFGVEAERDGTNLSAQRQDKYIILPSQIGRLPDLAGYLKLAGDLPVTKVSIPYQEHQKIAQDFVERPGLDIILHDVEEGEEEGKDEVNDISTTPDIERLFVTTQEGWFVTNQYVTFSQMSAQPSVQNITH